MKLIAPLTLVAMLLCGCPEAKIPKPPPRVPEPKADSKASQSGAAIQTPALRLNGGVFAA